MITFTYAICLLCIMQGVWARRNRGFTSRREKNQNILIIGGGIGGVTTAKFLEEKGYNDITLIERDEAIGGMCKSLKYDDYPDVYEMGAVLISPVYSYINDFIDEYSLNTLERPSVTLVDPLNGDVEDWESEDLKFDFLSSSELKKLEREVIKYGRLLLKYRHIAEPGLRNLDRRLCVPFYEWAEKNDIRYLQRVFLSFVTLYGYGYLGNEESDQIPLPYVMKYFGLREMVSVAISLSNPRSRNVNPSEELVEFLKEARKGSDCDGAECQLLYRIENVGFQGLVKAIANSLQHTKIITSANITAIDRTPNSVTAQWEKGGKVFSHEYRKMIIAFHQTKKNLESINIGLTRAEESLFSKVRTRNYFTLTAPLSCFDDDDGVYEMILKPGSALQHPKITLSPKDAFPSQIAVPGNKQSNGKAMSVIYVYSIEQISLDEVKQNVISYFKNLCNETLDTEDFRDAISWDYFAHVDADELANRFYDKIHRLQGRRNTYWTGSLMNFELTERTIAYSHQLVKDFF